MSKLYLATNEDVGDKSLVEALTDKGFDDTPMSKIIDDIGLAIQNKEGTTDYIPASEMAERIANLPSGSGHNLPKKYKELKSIKTNGGQYITIEQNFTYNKDVEIYADYKFDGFTQDWSLLIGNATQQFWIGANKNYLAYAFGGGDVKIKDFDTYKHHCELRNGSQKFDGDIIGAKSITNTVYQPLVLFAESSTSLGYVGEFYYMEIYRGDSTIHAFVPCYRIEDDVVGIYDLITNTFHTNQGTGSFVKGAIIGGDDLQSGGINYSMEEQDTGLTWVDGKKIYQKTVDVPLTRDLESKINHGISNFNELISIEGTVLTVDQTRGNLYRSFPFVYSGSGGANYTISIYDFDETSFMFVRGNAYYSNNTNIGGKFTFRYTKTTD